MFLDFLKYVPQQQGILYTYVYSKLLYRVEKIYMAGHRRREEVAFMGFWSSSKVEVHPKAVILAFFFSVIFIILAANLGSFIAPLILLGIGYVALIPMNRFMLRTDPRNSRPQSPPQ